MLVRWMVLGYQPLRVTEIESFRDMIHSINRQVRIPSRRDLVLKLESLEVTARAGVLKLLKGEMLALPEDAWTSAATQAYLSLTAHYLSKSFESISLPLECSPFGGSHTAEAIAEKTVAMLTRSGIPLDFVSAMVADNAANQVMLVTFASVQCCVPVRAKCLNFRASI